VLRCLRPELRAVYFLEDPGSRQCSAEQTSIPTETGAAENEIKCRPGEAFPFFQNEKQPCAKQSSYSCCGDDASSDLGIIAVAFQLKTDNPGGDERCESPKKTQTINRQWADFE